MKQDRHYNDILSGLQGELDPETFERCAVDLIRRHDDRFAVPVAGGDDGGMDGAIADGQGEPFPLVATTSKNVIGNLTRNLKRYLDTGGTRKKLILATSQQLTPRKRRNLEKRAQELGFTLVQILDQSAIAQRLYRDSAWCKELLRLTGEPAALSIVPITRRPLTDHELVGREDAERWLRETEGDKLLVGEPGAGKTSLLYQLARDERLSALFVVDADRAGIAKAIRDMQPSTLIVDDAHAKLELLESLQQLRKDIGEEFDLIASCWDGEKATVEAVFGSSPVSTHEVSRLTQDQMARVIIRAGIPGNNAVINEIVRQAEGLPGLAGTLCSLALRGNWQDVVNADALMYHVTDFYHSRTESGVAALLACFALGGNSGMDKSIVADAMRLDLTKLQSDLANLARGGIIKEVSYSADYISVWPVALRHALIRDMFFGGPAALPQSTFDALSQNAPDPVQATLALIGAYSRGATLLKPKIEDRLRRQFADISFFERYFLRDDFTSSNSQLLQAALSYAWQGVSQATWVLDNLPLRPALVAQPLLKHIPHLVIPELMKAAIGDNRPLNANPMHPLRILETWVKSARTVESAMQRRKSVLHAARSWLLDGDDSTVGYKVMLMSMIPEYEIHEVEPGSGKSSKLYFDCLPIDQLRELTKFWTLILETLQTASAVNWNELLGAIQGWVSPIHCWDRESVDMLRDFALKMALDLAELAVDRPGIIQRLRRISRNLRAAEDLPVDPVADALYPRYDHDGDHEAQKELATERVRLLASQLEHLEPCAVVGKLEQIEQDMNNGQGAVFRGSPMLCGLLAERVESPLHWFEAFAASSLPSELITPFAAKVMDSDQAVDESVLWRCLESDQIGLKTYAVQAILTHPSPPEDLKAIALRLAPEYAGDISWLLHGDRLRKSTVLELFQLGDKALSQTLAINVWICKPTEEVEDWLRPAWEDAILGIEDGSGGRGYLLKTILEADQRMAIRWLEHNIAGRIVEPVQGDRGLSPIIRDFPVCERKRLLGLVPIEGGCTTMLRALVADDMDLFKILLASDRYDFEKLAPLSRNELDRTWQEFAKFASATGIDDEPIITWTFPNSFGWIGDMSDAWAARRDKFNALANDRDPVIRRIALKGVRIFEDRFQQQKSQEQNEAVYGRDR